MLLRHVADAAPHALLGALAFDRGAVEMDRARHRRQLAEQGLQQVDLPAPLRPSTATAPRAGTFSDTPNSAWLRP